MFLLDTNVLSELRRRERTHPHVAGWIGSVDESELYLSAITILEIELGTLALERTDPTQGRLLRAWIQQKVLPSFAGRILAIDSAVAQCCARLHVPDPRPDRDAMIAATAIVHQMTVATRNTVDFEPMPVALFNPWTWQTPLETDAARAGKRR